LVLSKKAATSDKWTPWYDAGSSNGMGAWLAKYGLFENANFLW